MTLANHLYPVVRGRDSLIDLPLLQDGELALSDGITRCDLVFRREGVADFTISSSTQPSWFALQQPVVIDGITLSIIRANLRSIGQPPADGRYRVDVYLWDTENVNGRLWSTIDVEVRPAPPSP